MRVKAEAILEFGLADDEQQNKIVREYREEYKTISQVLDKRPKILEWVHRDIEQLRGHGCMSGIVGSVTLTGLLGGCGSA